MTALAQRIYHLSSFGIAGEGETYVRVVLMTPTIPSRQIGPAS